MSLLNKTLVGAAIGVGMLALTAANASAHIACVGPVCWHTHEAYEYPSDARVVIHPEYPSDARVVIHPDDWRWGPDEHYSWREHEGRGYWRGDRWTDW
jgi:hypothetical protein